MFSITINGNTIAELFSNLDAMLDAMFKTQKGDSWPFPPASSEAQTPAAPAASAAPAAPVAPAATPAVTPAAQTTTTIPPTAAPTYTLDQLARAGATLAQMNKMEQALALLNKYGVQSIHALKPEQYGAFATELRALGAQL